MNSDSLQTTNYVKQYIEVRNTVYLCQYIWVHLR